MDLYAGGQKLTDFGILNETSREGAGESLDKHGYALLRGFFDRSAVLEVRREIAAKLSSEGHLDPAFPVEECVASKGLNLAFRPDISNASQALKSLIYSDEVMSFFSALLGGDAIHYDYTWLRVVAPGKGTYPHCDIVYMGRGTRNLVTMWVPYGDVPLSVGGLLILENSHRLHELHETYGRLDVDAVCQTQQNQTAFAGFEPSGAIDNDFVGLLARYGG